MYAKATWVFVYVSALSRISITRLKDSGGCCVETHDATVECVIEFNYVIVMLVFGLEFPPFGAFSDHNSVNDGCVSFPQSVFRFSRLRCVIATWIFVYVSSSSRV